MAEPRLLTLGEHLDELRRHLIRGLIAVALFAAVALAFQDRLMAFVVHPHGEVARALEAERRERIAGSDAASLVALAEAGAELAQALRALEEGAGRPRDEALDRAAGERLDRALSALEARRPPPAPSARLTFLTYQEAFMAHLKLALLVGLLAGLPILLWELWRFVEEGLLPGERRYVRAFVPASLACLLTGLAFNYYVLVPISLRYLVTYGSAELFQPAITVDGYINLFFGLSLAMGVVFELPLALVLLAKVGLVTAPKLRAGRRFFLLGALLVSGVITPPDPWTMVLAAIPLVILYEVGIVAVSFVERRSPAPAE